MTNQNITIYHNPKCSKSREAVNYLTDANLEFSVVEYLKDVPSKSEITKLLQLLEVPLSEVIRISDDSFKQLNINISSLTLDQTADLIASNIKILQRPIIVINNKAVIARPIDKLINLLKK